MGSFSYAHSEAFGGCKMGRWAGGMAGCEERRSSEQQRETRRRGTGRGRCKVQRTAYGALSRHTGCGDTEQHSTAHDTTLHYKAIHCRGRRWRGSGDAGEAAASETGAVDGGLALALGWFGDGDGDGGSLTSSSSVGWSDSFIAARRLPPAVSDGHRAR